MTNDEYELDIEKLTKAFKEVDGAVLHMFVDGKSYALGVYFEKDDNWKKINSNLNGLSTSSWHKWMQLKHSHDTDKWPSLRKNRVKNEP